MNLLWSTHVIFAIVFLGVSIPTPKIEPFVLHILSENFHSLKLGYKAEESWAILKNIDLSSGTLRIPASDIESYNPNRQIFVLSKETSKCLLQDLESIKSDLILKGILKAPQFPFGFA